MTVCADYFFNVSFNILQILIYDIKGAFAGSCANSVISGENSTIIYLKNTNTVINNQIKCINQNE